MEKIKSFQVDHTKFGVGMYTSRIDDDIVTYDVRMVKPNSGGYPSSASLHTIEHIFATFVRNSEISDKVIYVGPMGCRTGFYLVVRNMDPKDAIELVRKTMKFIIEFDEEIPGCTKEECGNYKEHNLEEAKKDVKSIYNALEGYNEEMLDYNWHFRQT